MKIRRRTLTTGALAVAAVGAWPLTGRAASPKVLRYAFRVAETSLDPAKVYDQYSRILTSHMFEATYRYDHLARPVKIKPLTADGMPVSSADFRTWTVKILPGIHFAEDAAFKGRRRELVAQDYVYSMKRFADPASKSPVWGGMEGEGILGLGEQRQASLDGKKPFDYDREIDGLRAIDRFTLQFRLAEPRPRFIEFLAASDLFGAVAREVVEFYGDQIDAHPVGTGPFVLQSWRRSSQIVFVRNPNYRDRVYDAEAAPDDAAGQALMARFKGRKLPMVDRVEVSIIEQDQPRWLSFVNGESNFIERVGSEFVTVGMPAGKVAPNLAKQGIVGYQQVEPGLGMLIFNMDDPMVGGYTPEQVALRRAIGLGMDVKREIALLRNGQAVPAQGPYLPYTSAFDPKLKTEMSDYDPARAKALLDVAGFIDRDRDGWREKPDGSPLSLELNSQSDSSSRAIDGFFKTNMDALGIRTSIKIAQWPENLKNVRNGKFTAWRVAFGAAGYDASGSVARLDSKQMGGQNLARFKFAGYDEMFARMQAIPDGPEREAMFTRANQLSLAYMPYKYGVSRIVTDMAYPEVVGYRRPVFWQDWWQYMDIDDAQRRDKTRT